MKTKTYRQGDVLIETVSRIPSNAVKQVPAGWIILALGETTGHCHSVDSDSADWWKDGDDQFLDVPASAIVTHQEHGPIALPAGKYRVTRQREYSPEAIRNVAD